MVDYPSSMNPNPEDIILFEVIPSKPVFEIIDVSGVVDWHGILANHSQARFRAVEAAGNFDAILEALMRDLAEYDSFEFN